MPAHHVVAREFPPGQNALRYVPGQVGREKIAHLSREGLFLGRIVQVHRPPSGQKNA
jgi:hypothetical protein